MGTCYIVRKGGGAAESSGGNAHTLPSEYTQIDYLICGQGNEVSGFSLYNCAITVGDILEAITTTSETTSESAFFGGTSLEAYYNNGSLNGYSALTYDSNNAELIENGTLTKNTSLFHFSSSAAEPFYIGYYQPVRYPYYGRIYSIRIFRYLKDVSGVATEQEELVIDLIPCIKNEDNTVGLFDLIHQIFYPSLYNPFVAPST